MSRPFYERVWVCLWKLLLLLAKLTYGDRKEIHLQQNKKGRLDVCLKHAFGKVCACSPCSACSSYATSPGEAILIFGTNRSFCFSPTTLIIFKICLIEKLINAEYE
ncbi:hypothetical protein T01_3542 [Trichinella spiralis]|uniref:Secreted protein n=1 Tax=Trichinella spiralis TaxID=6334 RepID=A0A0V1BJ70_TRISP|nr:hypothetical protein T01_3542 [Trichinella spiralis]